MGGYGVAIRSSSEMVGDRSQKGSRGGTLRAPGTLPWCMHARCRPPPTESHSPPHPKFPAEAWAKRVHAAISALAAVPAADAALALFLAAAAVASESARLELVTYDLFEQAFLLYEESVPDSRRQASALAAIVGTLHRCRVLDADARGALVHKAAGYCSKLLRRADQCLAVLAVSHLYYQEEGAGEGAEETDASQSDATGAHPAPPGAGQTPPPHPAVRDGAAVLSCLKRALRITHAQQQQLLQTGRGELEGPGFLFVEILNHYLYYYERGVAAITLSALQVGVWGGGRVFGDLGIWDVGAHVLSRPPRPPHTSPPLHPAHAPVSFPHPENNTEHGGPGGQRAVQRGVQGKRGAADLLRQHARPRAPPAGRRRRGALRRAAPRRALTADGSWEGCLCCAGACESWHGPLCAPWLHSSECTAPVQGRGRRALPRRMHS